MGFCVIFFYFWPVFMFTSLIMTIEYDKFIITMFEGVIW